MIAVDILKEHDVVDRAEDDERHERRQEGAQTEIADQIAVDRAANDAERQHRRGSVKPTGQPSTFMQIEREQHGQARRPSRPRDRCRPRSSRSSGRARSARIRRTGGRDRSALRVEKKSGIERPEHDDRRRPARETGSRCRSSAWSESPRSGDRGDSGSAAASEHVAPPCIARSSLSCDWPGFASSLTSADRASSIAAA